MILARFLWKLRIFFAEILRNFGPFSNFFREMFSQSFVNFLESKI